MQKFPWLTLRHLGWLEGASFIILLFIAMPLKYLAGYPQVVSVVGMAHGILFLAFVGWVFIASRMQEWSALRTIKVLSTSVIPFAPFFTNFEEEPKPAADVITESA